MAAPGRIQVLPQISQETYDQVVRENIDEFEMEPDEAVEDASQQFISQGIDLSNILKRVPGDGDENSDAKHPAMVALGEYTEMIAKDSVDPESVQTLMDAMIAHFKDKAVRHLVSSNGGVAVLLAGCEKFVSSEKSTTEMIAAFNGLAALVYEHPDILGKVQQTCLEVASGETATPTPEITRIIVLLGLTEEVPEAQTVLLKVVRYGCFMHESNRQAFVKGNIIRTCLNAAEKHFASDATILQAMLCLRNLTKDDDVRVPFGKGMEHANMIAQDNNGLERLLTVLSSCYNAESPNAATASELFKTLSQLANRDEFCKKIVDLGCLDYVLPAMQTFPNNESVAYGGCTLLRAVAGNDAVKQIIGARGGIALIIETMNTHMKVEKIAEQGAAALAAITLKTSSNATAIADAEGQHILVKLMYMYPDAQKLQRQVCLALRNMVVRNPELIEPVLGQGAESAINVCLKNHSKTCGDEAKAALVVLQCKVNLKELWKGEMRQNDREIDGSKRVH